MTLVNSGNRQEAAEAPDAAAQLTGLRKAALLFAQWTDEEAAMVLPELRPRELERLTVELVRLRNIDVAVVDDDLNELHGLMRAGRVHGSGGEGFARDVLAAAIDPDKADDFLARLNVVYTEVPFASLRNTDVRHLVTFLEDEHP
jgi:flagellar motor switch protein FliG